VFAVPRDEEVEDDGSAEADGLEQGCEAVDEFQLVGGVNRLPGASRP
jgi:hypothetical protein